MALMQWEARHSISYTDYVSMGTTLYSKLSRICLTNAKLLPPALLTATTV